MMFFGISHWSNFCYVVLELFSQTKNSEWQLLSVPSLFNFLSNQNGNEKIVSQRRTAVEVPLEINKNWGKMVGRACLLKWGWKILNWCYSDYNAFIAKSNLQLESWHIFAKFHKYWPTRSKDILLVAYFIPTLYRK